MQAIVLAANGQDHDGGVMLMGTLVACFPFPFERHADSGNQGPRIQADVGTACRQVNLEIVRRLEPRIFAVLPKRLIVERTIGGLNRCRRLAKDWQCSDHDGHAFPLGASVRVMVGRSCQST